MEKYYVDENNQTIIICHKCGLSKNLDVSKFKDTHKKLKAKCKCGENFRLNLDFRRHYRKKVQLAGECFIKENCSDQRSDNKQAEPNNPTCLNTF